MDVPTGLRRLSIHQPAVETAGYYHTVPPGRYHDRPDRIEQVRIPTGLTGGRLGGNHGLVAVRILRYLVPDDYGGEPRTKA